MQVSDVKKEDLEQCASLIELLKLAKYELSFKDIMAARTAIEWVIGLGKALGSSYNPAKPKDDFVVKEYNPGTPIPDKKKAK